MIVSAVGIAVGVPYVGLALTAGGALHGLGSSAPSCAPAWMKPVGTLISGTAVVVLVFLAGLLSGDPRRIARPLGAVRS